MDDLPVSTRVKDAPVVRSIVCFILFRTLAIAAVVCVLASAYRGYKVIVGPSEEEIAVKLYPQVASTWAFNSAHELTYCRGYVPERIRGPMISWYEARARPQDIPAIEDSLKTFVKKSRSWLPMPANSPDWWRPDEVRDANVWLSKDDGSEMFFITSRSTGSIYFYYCGYRKLGTKAPTTTFSGETRQSTGGV